MCDKHKLQNIYSRRRLKGDDFTYTLLTQTISVNVNIINSMKCHSVLKDCNLWHISEV